MLGFACITRPYKISKISGVRIRQYSTQTDIRAGVRRALRMALSGSTLTEQTSSGAGCSTPPAAGPRRNVPGRRSTADRRRGRYRARRGSHRRRTRTAPGDPGSVLGGSGRRKCRSLAALGSSFCIVERPARSGPGPGRRRPQLGIERNAFNNQRINELLRARQKHGIGRDAQRLGEPCVAPVSQRLVELDPKTLKACVGGRVFGVATIGGERNARCASSRHLHRRRHDWSKVSIDRVTRSPLSTGAGPGR